MSHAIYILEDDTDMVRIMERELTQQGFRVRAFDRCRDFTQAIGLSEPDLCLIDLGLPDGDGLSIVSELLRAQQLPTIIVSGRGDLADRVVGLEVGADDYIVKPFEPRELSARVRAVLRRADPRPAASTAGAQTAQFNGWSADFSACTLTEPGGRVSNLSAAEAALLHAFLKSAGHVLSRAQLLDAGNPNELEPFDRSIDARISRLRRKLRDDVKSPQLIRTVYGAGYVFVAKVNWPKPGDFST